MADSNQVMPVGTRERMNHKGMWESMGVSGENQLAQRHEIETDAGMGRGPKGKMTGSISAGNMVCLR